MPSEGSEDEEEDEDYGRTPDLCSPVRGKKAGRGGRDGVELGAHSHGGKFAKTGPVVLFVCEVMSGADMEEAITRRQDETA
eukprot:208831-Rhodomonas_salina.3